MQSNQDQSSLAMAMKEVDDSFEEDQMFGNSDDDIEHEAARFDRKKRGKAPVVIEISDDDKRKKKKTLKV